MQSVSAQGPQLVEVPLGTVLGPLLCAGRGHLGQGVQVEAAGGGLVVQVAQVNAQVTQAQEPLGSLPAPESPAVQP
eukprot:10477738-Lingulodinium_polyedra.AAC.2